LIVPLVDTATLHVLVNAPLDVPQIVMDAETELAQMVMLALKRHWGWYR